MSWQILANLASTAAQSTFGQSVTYSRKSGGTQQVRGIFDVQHTENDIDGAPTSYRRTSLTVRLADFGAAPVRGDSLVGPDARTYEVAHVLDDGYGGAELVLMVRS